METTTLRELDWWSAVTEKATFAQIQSWASNEIARAGFTVSLREIQLLLMAAGDLSKAQLIACSQQPCPAEIQTAFREYISRRLQHEPVYRILGSREFHGLDLELNEATLEPRDDTECLVEAVLDQFQGRNNAMRFLDIGTGTGAIALALLSELPNATCLAVDVEPRALQAAKANASKHGLQDRFEAIVSYWFGDVAGKFDFIVSNPPYIASSEVAKLELEVRGFDPDIALDGGEDGLDAYREILAGAQAFLHSGGFLGLEIGFDQKDSVRQLALNNRWNSVSSFQDMAGMDRALIIQ